MKREAPEIHWRAVIGGGAATLLLTFALSLVAAIAASPLLLFLAVPVGVVVGGAAAGRLARTAGALHGGLVAALWIVASALAGSSGPGTPDVLADTALTVVWDAAWLAAGALAGWLGARSAGGS